MSKEIVTFGSIKDGIIRYTKKDEFVKSTLDTFGEGERFFVIHRKIYRRRSSLQQNYWWGVIINCFLDGYKSCNGHEFGVEFTNHNTGEILHIPLPKKEQAEAAHEVLLSICNLDDEGNIRRSHENTTTQELEMHDKARDYIKFAFNVTVPLPGDQGIINFQENT